MKKILNVTIGVWLSSCLISMAQSPESFSSAEILLRMKKLDVLGSVLYIAAHPDDENTRLLAWLSKDQLYRTGYLSLTRGDGGQNLIGDEQGIELGLIRTQELLAARKVDGAEQFFSRAYDFGFSKTTEEALKFWNEQKILSDVVWVIRKFQPDIIITRFPEDKRAGHGQHSASSVLARLAFTAAADPKQFPEQFAYGVKPWQATRIFWNSYQFGRINTTSEDQLKIEVGNYNNLLGKSYGEIAADSRSQHKSQGFGLAHSRGNVTEYFSLTKGDSARLSLMQNINTNWERVAGGKEIENLISTLIKTYDPAEPYKSVSALTAIYKKIESLPVSYWRDKKLAETGELVRACSGLWLEANVPEAYAVQNQPIPVTVRVLNRAPIAIQVISVALNHQDTSWNQSLLPGTNYSLIRKVRLDDLPVSQPYWLQEPMFPGSYNVSNQQLIGRAENPPVLEADFRISVEGQVYEFHQPVVYKFTDAVKGEMFEPLTIVPGRMALCDPDLLVFTQGKEKELLVKRQWKTVRHDEATGPLFHPTSNFPDKNNHSAAAQVEITPVPGFQTKVISISKEQSGFLLKSDRSNDQHNNTWALSVNYGKTDTLLQCRTISYDHIPRIDYFRQAKSTVVSLNLETRGTRVGYIDGAGDRVVDALNAMGYTVIRLDEKTVSPSILQSLDAIVTGVRAYDVHDWLTNKYSVLMDYVKNGGNLIVQYNRSPDDSTSMGPYPFNISAARVTEEDAAVNFLLPEHPLLHFPNQITAKDFEGWIQERGIYFAQKADPNYQSVFSMHDTGEADLQGSLITCRYGKGNFTYTGLVFFRELPAGVPGAYRLFANLIALNQYKDK